MSEPFLAHSEISNEIYIICGKKKYCVTEQVISAMKATGRLNERPQGYWIDKGLYNECSECKMGYMKSIIEKCLDSYTFNYCPHCGADLRGGRE